MHHRWRRNLQTIDDKERSDVAGVGGVTADADRCRSTGGSGAVDDVDTGGLALEGCGGVGGGPVLELFLTDGGNRAGEVALSLYAVSDDDRFLKELGILLKDDVVDGLVANSRCRKR